MKHDQPTQRYEPFPATAADATAVFDTFESALSTRRSVREYDPTRPVDQHIIERVLALANSAPSGANKQPWHFVAVSDPAIKKSIREAAEEEERAFYGGRASDAWLDDLKPFGTDAQKPFLEHAPWLIVAFKKSYDLDAQGEKSKNYYVTESAGIAAGMLISAIHMAGLATLTHTPSPMGFLSEILQRPPNEKAFLLLPVGYPAPEVHVPAIQKKGMDEVVTFLK